MTIRNEVYIELWDSIKKNYESENYSGAILDSILKLTDTIRNKTGLEGDGASLVGQAFGGDNPRIKLNKLQTDSEKDVQRGMQEILRGIYTAVRNPRSHDTINDIKADADAIIVFTNYLLGLIEKSKLSFEEDDFLKRVFDPHYVKTKEYSNLIIQEIPKRQRANIAISTILKRNEGDINSLGYFIASLLDSLDETELSRVYKVVSDELRITTNEDDIRYLVHICPGKYWDNIDKSVRLRTESILFKDFSQGTYNTTTDDCGEHGSLATWITADHLKNFNELAKWTRKAVEMATNPMLSVCDYTNKYMWHSICEANKVDITAPLKNYFKSALNDGLVDGINKLRDVISRNEDHPWWQVFEKELEKYPEIKHDDLPF